MTSDVCTSAPAHPIVGFARRLGAALDALAPVAAWSMTSAEQRSALVDLAQAQARLDELRLRVLVSADRSEIGAEHGATSTAAWLAHHAHQARPAAHADVRLAHALDQDCSETRTALSQGRITTEQARIVVHAVADLPDTVPPADRQRAERAVLEAAPTLTLPQLRIVARRLLEYVDPDEADRREGELLEAEEREARRRTFLRMRDNHDGTRSGSFRIPTLHAAMLDKALHALTSPRRRTTPDGPAVDPRSGHTSTPEQLGRGFCELLERLPAELLPASGGRNATVVVTMTLDSLLTGLGAASLDTGHRISAGQARLLACEAGVIPAVLGSRSRVLDLGRRVRFHNDAQRLALSVQHAGCVADLCDRPPAWCEIHHRVPWSEGGATDLTGVPLCARHHHHAHDPGYEMTYLSTGKVAFHRRT